LDDVLVCTSEACSNAIEHTHSQEIVVAVYADERQVQVTVEDAGGATVPQVRDPGFSERGRGMLLIDTLASYWYYELTPTNARLTFRVAR